MKYPGSGSQWLFTHHTLWLAALVLCPWPSLVRERKLFAFVSRRKQPSTCGGRWGSEWGQFACVIHSNRLEFGGASKSVELAFSLHSLDPAHVTGVSVFVSGGAGRDCCRTRQHCTPQSPQIPFTCLECQVPSSCLPPRSSWHR